MTKATTVTSKSATNAVALAVEMTIILTMILVTSSARNQTVSHSDVKTIYQQCNSNTHDFFERALNKKTCIYKCKNYI